MTKKERKELERNPWTYAMLQERDRRIAAGGGKLIVISLALGWLLMLVLFGTQR